MEHHLSRKFIISCEHSSNEVPEKYKHLFEQDVEILNTHRGWDPGASVLATILSEKLDAPLFSYPWTRLLIEPNRSLGHHQLYSKFSAAYPHKKELINQFYTPYRDNVEKEISKILNKRHQAVHLSVHTFTPILDNNVREFDIGLLYDPKRESEKQFSKVLRKSLKEEFRVKMNQPYKGSADGFTTYLRKRFNGDCYLGIELEVNQALYFDDKIKWKNVCDSIAMSIKSAINSIDQ